MVGHEPYTNDKSETAHANFERLSGELDAAIVFAAAAKEAFQNEEVEFGNACFSDAEDSYTNVISALSGSALPGEQLRYLHLKMNNLRECLDKVHLMTLPSAGEAA
jgi:hypothetical protein